MLTRQERVETAWAVK